MSDLTNCLRPGDELNTEGVCWKGSLKSKLLTLAALPLVGTIQETQKDVFCRSVPIKTVRYRDSHSMMYLGPTNVFNVTVPKPRWSNIAEWDELDGQRIVSVYRMNPAYFGRELNGMDIELLTAAANEVIKWGRAYDMGHNVDILVSTIAGYPYSHKIQWFDAGPKSLVCSVGVATVIAHWRHALKKITGEDLPQPFKKLNPAAWPKEFVEKYPGHWEIGATFPANYAVTDTHFANEFSLVGRFKGGKQIV